MKEPRKRKAKDADAPLPPDPAAPAPMWMPDEIERWSIERLVPYARNARKHSPEQISEIAGSMQQFGFTIPVMVKDDGTIVAGHGRVLAALQLGLTTAPVIKAPTHWTEEQFRAYVLADNRIALNSSWDKELLKMELGDLRMAEVDLTGLGFTDWDVQKLLDLNPGGDSGGADVVDDERFTIIVECTTEQQHAALYEELQGRGLAVKMMA
jgi:hypothetical protein